MIEHQHQRGYILWTAVTNVSQSPQEIHTRNKRLVE